jgi:5S rRNA maturation endonuclease (ribonuclease M5)
MNSHQAKQIDLPNLMSRLGYEPTAIKKGGNEYWYRSPFRSEKDASFHTSYLGGKWIWKDFGDIGGTVIDFVMRHERLNSVKEALNYLEGIYPANSLKSASRVKKSGTVSKNQATLFSFQQQSPPQEGNFENRELEFLKAHQIQNPVIFSYLSKRGIPTNLSESYLREERYRNTTTGKEFIAFGMGNRSGGYEIRAASDDYKFKSALVARDITIIKGQNQESNTVNIFEGMLDFLSLVAMFNVSQLSGDSIVMHSLSSFQQTVTAIKSMGYEKVNLFLDNNRAGKEHSQKFQSELGEIVISQSHLFEPYEDVNDALVANAILTFK